VSVKLARRGRRRSQQRLTEKEQLSAQLHNLVLCGGHRNSDTFLDADKVANIERMASERSVAAS